MQIHRHWDVIIIGAGIAGCATAIALLQQLPKLSVLLLERKKNTPQPFRIGETLPPQAMVLLQQLGLQELFRLRNDTVSLGNRSVWGSPQVNENPFLYSCYGHGWHLSINQNGAGILNLETSIVVDASGVGAAFCRNQNVDIETFDKLIGIFRYYQADGNHAGGSDGDDSSDSFTLVESCSYGWWYSAGLPHGRWVAALMTDSDLARQSDLLNEVVWQNTLRHTHHTFKRLADKAALTSLQVKPAHSQKLERFCGLGWYAAGDAASTFDPLSSLGMYKTMRHGLLVSYAVKDDLQNKSGAKEKYQHGLHSEFEQYRQTHRQYYQLEKRFAEAPFWQRRHNGLPWQ